ncbi:beta-N-acetylhexosaminidase [Siphonobacter sp. SORGH_AS_1065]|uniref:beta-N-acetylhexosaminidase n=1 Tax=Siphonobacter sp. SORGH_AS_1065 TaxID=3041795 RepID=UPI00278000B4|nr:family 20 glycosylhydrolase [Siphonobacter sp. SORGH_AS_1065]MDQ1087293.1 hexosaminidase [Siphonobacter sp. SORGH_AS_1065]
MKRFILSAFLAAASLTSFGQSIIPQPVSLQQGSGKFQFTNQTQVVASTPEAKRLAGLLNQYLKKRTGAELKIVSKAPASNYIAFIEKTGLPAEGYELKATPQSVQISGKDAGLFYGLQSVMQLITGDAKPEIASVTIEDHPRFGYRGLMMDVGRHYMPLSFIKQMIDEMAMLKFNRFHWHLTEDQGWRLEIKKYPKLTQVGAYRDETLIGGYGDRMPQQFDGIKYGGFYTQDEAREVVKYAAERHITVIPEIELPGHATAALAAYPELGCTPGPFKVQTTWGVHKDVFCPKEETFQFLENVLTEVMDIFPSPYIHIGGDECPKDRWKESEFCQNLIKKENLKDEHGLQSYFIRRIEKFLNSKGRNIIGWDEILEGGLAPNATVMSWRGEEGGIAAAKENHDVIMSPNGYVYIDHYQSKDRKQEPLAIGGFLPLEKVYSYNPTPKELTAEQQKHIKGVQANLWTEYIPTAGKAQYMYFPRAMALAEVAWSPLNRKDFTEFSEQRLPVYLRKLEKRNLYFRVPEAIGMPKEDTLRGSQFTINLKAPVEGAKIYYTIDGYMPSEATYPYSKPISLTIPQNRRVDLKTIVVTPAGHRSIVSTTTLVNGTPMPDKQPKK